MDISIDVHLLKEWCLEEYRFTLLLLFGVLAKSLSDASTEGQPKGSGGCGNYGHVVRTELGCHLPFILLPEIHCPLMCVRSDTEMTRRYSLHMLHLVIVVKVIPGRSEISFMIDWSLIL